MISFLRYSRVRGLKCGKDASSRATSLIVAFTREAPLRRSSEEKQIINKRCDVQKRQEEPCHVIIIIKFSSSPLLVYSNKQIASLGKSAARELSSSSDGIHSTAQLFEELESVETQYESIVQRLPSDCSEINSADNGLHMIAPMRMRRPIMAKCDGPWTVVQKRQDGSVDFNRSWEEYAKGFGDPNGELWIGNEILHHLTSDNCTKLRIVIQDLQNNSWYADYESFSIASRAEGYRIDFSGYSGNASNTLEYQNHMKFSSIDVDLDISKGHCADEYEVRSTLFTFKVNSKTNFMFFSFSFH